MNKEEDFSVGNRGINRNKLVQLFSRDELWFPLIISVIEQNQEGIIFVNNNDNPTHAFVINKFGFCQEVYETYDKAFFEDKIRPFIESRDRIKLRMYHPGKCMEQYLSELSFASKAIRVHMIHETVNGKERSVIDYVIREVRREEAVRDDFGLELVSRYYNGVDDFIEHAEALGAYTDAGEMIGIVYSAGEALRVCEKDIFVKPKFRRRGIGKRLTECFIEKCWKKNKHVSEDIYENNDASVALAKAIGAKMVGRYVYYNIDKL